jgi:hypothetical protein
MTWAASIPPRSTDVEGRISDPFFTADGRQVGAVRDLADERIVLDFWDARSLEHARRVTPRYDKERYFGSGFAPPYFRVLIGEGKDVRLHVLDPDSGRQLLCSEPVEGVEQHGVSADGHVAFVGNRTEYQVYRLPDPRKP